MWIILGRLLIIDGEALIQIYHSLTTPPKSYWKFQCQSKIRYCVNIIFDLYSKNLLRIVYRSQNPTIIPDVSPKETCNEDDDPPSRKLPYRADELFVKSYGRSLMVGYCDTYMSDFVLMGLPRLDEFQESLDIDLKNSLLVKLPQLG